MKKILFFCLTLFPLCSLCSYDCTAICDKQDKKEYEFREDKDCNWVITIKNAFFYPKDKVLRDIFNRSGSKGGYWFEAAARYNLWKDWNIEASGSYFAHKGRALYSNDWVKVKIPTLGLGLKYFFSHIDFCDNCDDTKWAFFLGAGLRVFFYKENNNYPYVLNCIKKTTVGGMINAGLEFKVYKGLLLDLFADYNFKKLHLNGKDLCGSGCCKPSCTFDLQIGGLVAGIGLGFGF